MYSEKLTRTEQIFFFFLLTVQTKHRNISGGADLSFVRKWDYWKKQKQKNPLNSIS